MLTNPRIAVAGGTFLLFASLGCAGSFGGIGFRAGVSQGQAHPNSEPGPSPDYRPTQASHCVRVEAGEDQWSLDPPRVHLSALQVIHHEGQFEGLRGWDSRLVHPEWSPDDTSLLFTVIGSDSCPSCELRESEVWLAETRSGEARTLVRRGRNATWSPDAKKVAFLKGNEGRRTGYRLAVLDLETGEEAILPTRRGFTGIERLLWQDLEILVGAEGTGMGSRGGLSVHLDDLTTKPLGWSRDRTIAFNQRKSVDTYPWTLGAFTDQDLPRGPGPPNPWLWNGLWAVTDYFKYAVRLRNQGAHSPTLSHDRTRLAFIQLDDTDRRPSSDGGSVVIGDLNQTTEPIPAFDLDAASLPGLVVGDALGVYSARFNPLNGRAIGYFPDDFRGSVVVTRIDGQRASVRPLVDTGMIEAGLVAACPTDRRGWRGEAAQWAVLSR